MPCVSNFRKDEGRGYERDNSRSPRADIRGGDSRARSASPDGRGDNRYVQYTPPVRPIC